MTFQSVTFDLDGTLLDTIVDQADACNAMLLELGKPPRELEEIRRFVGKGTAVLVERCLSDNATRPDAAALKEGIASYCRHYAEVNGRSTRLYPGVIDGLEELRDRGLKLACVTNKPAVFTLPLLERMGLARYLPVVVSGDTISHKKPSPEPILYACALMKSAPDANVHVGDSVNDIEAARAAGSMIVCVPYGYNEGNALCSADCDALITNLAEVPQWIATAPIQPGSRLSAKTLIRRALLN